jgi:hypothetical protein
MNRPLAALNPPRAAATSLVAMRRTLASMPCTASAGTANRTVAVPSVPASSSSAWGSTATLLPLSSRASRSRRTATVIPDREGDGPLGARGHRLTYRWHDFNELAVKQTTPDTLSLDAGCIVTRDDHAEWLGRKRDGAAEFHVICGP